jgi:hypothetical protein
VKPDPIVPDSEPEKRFRLVAEPVYFTPKYEACLYTCFRGSHMCETIYIPLHIYKDPGVSVIVGLVP